MRVLILGGYGTFGSRLARLLAEDRAVELIIAGRDISRADALAAELGGQGAPVDRDDPELAGVLKVLAPDVVVDASGPFQAYGRAGDSYRVIEACLAAGADYLDLADSAGFVAGVGILDGAARAAGRVVLSGLSTLPALSFAVARRLAADLDTLDSLAVGVAPSPRAPLGLSVVAAIAGYAGTALPLRRDGADNVGLAMVEGRRWTIAPPGGPALAPRLFLLADAPDLRLAPQAWPDLKDVWVGAGTAPQGLLHLLRGLAWLRSRGLAPSLAPFAPLFHAVKGAFAWGPDRGGMIVEARGHADGRPLTLSWSLVAQGADGPYIPAMAAAALIRRLVAGRRPASGARPATDELDLADFEPFFAARRITVGVVRA
jgi:hypothetical protein